MPVCLCFDTSNSMYGMPLKNLKSALDVFLSELETHDSVETAIITFGAGVANCLKDFHQSSMKRPRAEGIASITEGTELALDVLEARQMAYSEMRVEYYRPWLLLTLNGTAAPRPFELQRAAARVRESVQNNELEVFPVATCPFANLKVLEAFSPSRRALCLRDYDFEGMLLWFAENIIRITENPGKSKVLTSPRAWLES